MSTSSEEDALPLHPEGHLPRKKLPQRPVVEAAPSHDGAPCFTAYSVDDETTDRPLFALVLYDTTPEANDPEYVRALALKIHTGTEHERCQRTVRDDRDRIEVVGLPRRADESEEERIERCKTHYLAEVAARKATGARDFYLPATFHTYGYWRRLILLERLGPGWEEAALFRAPPPQLPGTSGSVFGLVDDYARGEPLKYAPALFTADPHGGLLDVSWELTDAAHQENAEIVEEWGDKERLPEQNVYRLPISRLAAQLASCREFMGVFGCFAADGGLDAELRAAKSS